MPTRSTVCSASFSVLSPFYILHICLSSRLSHISSNPSCIRFISSTSLKPTLLSSLPPSSPSLFFHLFSLVSFSTSSCSFFVFPSIPFVSSFVISFASLLFSRHASRQLTQTCRCQSGGVEDDSRSCFIRLLSLLRQLI